MELQVKLIRASSKTAVMGSGSTHKFRMLESHVFAFMLILACLGWLCARNRLGRNSLQNDFHKIRMEPSRVKLSRD